MKRAMMNILILGAALHASACLELDDALVEPLTSIVASNPTDSPSTTTTTTPSTPMTFLAYTNNGSRLASTDGVTWTSSSISGGPTSIDKIGIIGTTLYGINTDGSANGVIWTSTDTGTTWSQITVSGGLGFPWDFLAVCGTNIVVAYNDTGNTQLRAFASTDSGATWGGPHTVHSTSTGALRGLACDGSRFVVAFSETPYIRFADSPYSTWTAATPTPASNVVGSGGAVAVGNGRVVALMAQTSPRESLSTDNGASFTSGQDIGFNFGNNNTVTAYQNSRFFVAGHGGGNASFGFSTNGGNGNWTFTNTTFANNVNMSGIYGNGSSSVVFVGTDSVSSAPVLFYSTDNGATVTQATLPGSIGSTMTTVIYVP